MIKFTFVLSDEQSEEIRRCTESLSYFVENYLKISDPKRGWISVQPYDFQRRYLDALQKERFLLVPKFRQGGFTTFNLFHKLWKAIFFEKQTILWITKTDREAMEACLFFKKQIDQLPEWLTRGLSKSNDHQIEFDRSESKIFFYTPEATRGRSVTDLVIDEAAYFKGLDKFWLCVVPTIATGGNATIVSSCKRLKKGEINWFKSMLDAAKKGENEFEIFNSYWQEHPEFHTEEWIKNTKSNLGEIDWRVEVECEWVEVDEDEPKHKPNVNLAPVEMKIIHRNITRPLLFEQPKHKADVNATKVDDGIINLHIEADHLDLTKTGLPEAEVLHKIVAKAAETVGHVEHPNFGSMEDEESVCKNIDEVWNNITEVMPDTKFPKKYEPGKVPFDYENVDLETLAMAGVVKEGDFLSMDIDYKEELIDKIKRGLPKQLNLEVNNSVFMINGVPTKINAKAIEMAVLGLAELSSADKAVNTVSRLVRRKLQRLF